MSGSLFPDRRITSLRSAALRSAWLRSASAEVRPAEIREDEVCPAQARPAEIRLLKVRAFSYVLFSPQIPGLDSFFDLGEVFGVAIHAIIRQAPGRDLKQIVQQTFDRSTQRAYTDDVA